MTSIDPSSLAYKKARRQHLKTTRNRDNDLDQEWTPFRAVEKQYRARFPPPDLSNVLDLEASDNARGGCSDRVEYQATKLKGVDGNRKAYTIPRIPGLVLLPSFVSSEKQKQLVWWSLSDHAKYPNETNLDIHYILPQDGLWNTYLKSRTNATEDSLIQPRALRPEDTSASERTEPGPRKLIDNTPATPSSFQSVSTSPKPPATPSPTVQPCPPSALLRKLRWANIGWYYHWGSKQYDFSKGKGNICSEVRQLCKNAVGAVDWEDVFSGPASDLEWGQAGPEWKTWDDTYEPDAGIINFYQTKDTLMAHVDRSEVCATSPLVSISLGNSAIFLIGGLTRHVKPIPILLRSGDVIIMSGPACRRVYHGVPRVLEDTLPPYLGSDDDGVEWKPYEEYLRTTRININVRQVFPKGFDPCSEGR